MIENETFETFVRQVDHILWTEWDPIGCGVPDDEYSSYAPVVAEKAIKGETAKQIMSYLYWVESDQMGLTRTRDDVDRRTAGIVTKIMDMASMLRPSN